MYVEGYMILPMLTIPSLQHAPNIISINTEDHVTNGSVYKSIRLDLGLTWITHVNTAQSVVGLLSINIYFMNLFELI